jgi:glutathione S-transferase
MLELYHHSTSVCAAKVRLVLHEKKLEWSGHFIDIFKGEQYDPAYLKLNPKGVVPTLIHDGRVIRESTLIGEYLDEVFPAPRLSPADPYGRVQMRLWTKMVDENLHIACAAVTFALFHRFNVLKMAPEQLDTYLNNTRDPLFRERKHGWVHKGLEAPDVRQAIKVNDKMLADMEAALETSPWVSGPDYSLADISLTPYVNRLAMLGLDGMWRNRPRVGDWFARIRTRPNFKPAVIDWIPEQMAATMNKNGTEQWPYVERVLETA